MLDTLVADFARAMMRADAKRPVAISATMQRAYQPGIGPHTETATLQLIRNELLILNRDVYNQIEVGIPYPNAPRQKCDRKWTSPSNKVFMIEAKMFRLMGDNGKPNDNILTHILSPYPQQRSALTDCAKLLSSGFSGATTILIYAYKYTGYPLEPLIDAFEYLAGKSVALSKCLDRHFVPGAMRD